ncbi:MAG: CoA transferase [Proteobacteria bacterium]|nr:CoA transferase [Pseudomonadota bacterium]
MGSSPLDELRRELGLRLPAAGQLEINGREPVLPCRFPLARLAASALAAGGLAVSELWELCTGRRQRVGIDLSAAAASLLGFAVLEGGPPLPRPLATSSLYRGADGRWIHLHGGFPDSPHLSDGILQLLDCADTTEAIAAGVAKWPAQKLEDALAAAGLCGAVVRTPEEWAEHPQGRALGRLPVVEVIKIGDSPPERPRVDVRPLDGVRVLDLTRVLAGPTCARTLAEHGADVLHVCSRSLPNFPAFVADTGHGKLSADLDLTRDGDVSRLRALVAEADVFSQGYRTGSLERRGFGPEELAALRPGLICVSVNCYGHEGPWRERPGWEQLAQSTTGIVHGHGRPDRPQLVPAAACDYTTGYLAALGALVALVRRAREGGSYHVRASLCQTAMWIERHGCDALAPSRPVSVELGDPPALDPTAIEPWRIQSETPYGRLTHLGPVLRLSETPTRWARPSVPLGTHPAEWPPRRAGAERRTATRSLEA